MNRSVDDNVDVIRRGYDAINREGPDGAREFMDPDIVLEMPEGLIDAGSYHGREALMRVWHAYFDEFEQFRWEVERLIGAGDRVFLRVRERGRGRQSGAEVDWQRWWVYTLRAMDSSSAPSSTWTRARPSNPPACTTTRQRRRTRVRSRTRGYRPTASPDSSAG
jgi:ketosteroid isomerase-like protein